MPTENAQWVILRIDAGLYAIPSSRFQEVIPLKCVTPIPFVQPYIEGLVNIDGRIATQIDLGRVLSQHDFASPGNELALIHTGRSLCALRVQNVVAIVDADDETIRYFEIHNPGETQSGCVCGEWVYQNENVLLLDPHAIGTLVKARDITPGHGGLDGRVRLHESDSSNTDQQLLVARIGNEQFCFAIEQLTELVKIEHCTPIPGAPTLLCGLILLRGQPILTVSLQQLLNPAIPLTQNASQWIMLVEHEGITVGLHVDDILGIEMHASNKIVATSHPDNAIRGIIENTHGMLSMLVDIPALFTSSAMATLQCYLPSRMQIEHAEDTDFRTCLSVSIHNELFAIPLESVSRVIAYKPMESTHDQQHAILGAIDVDGRVVPVVNMGAREACWSEYVIVESHQTEYAIRVNATHRVLDMPVKQFSRSKNTANPFVSAIAHHEDCIYSIFNSEHLTSLQLS